MATFILVHGSFHGAWCWRQMIERLEGRGHRVVAVDLPGHGDDRTPVAQCTLAAYVARVNAVLDAQREKAVLVGHSMGGVVVTQAAEDLPEKIARLVYVCAYVPRDGQSLLELAKLDTQSELLPQLVFEPPIHRVKPGAAKQVFYADVPEPLANECAERLIAEPLAVVDTKVKTSAARWGALPRRYVRCTNDKTVGPKLQAQMAEGAEVVTLASSHSPFLSMPDELVRAIT